ncbi:HAMP domain-containing histidine kinase [Candidatus Peribacteria bacterium]|nr:MAG: HAMP domain-containing histidine kinase [Candidatus Peribacteria bacterium]
MQIFWKRWPIITLSLLIALSITSMGVVFYTRARDIMQEQLHQRLEHIAASAALFISGDSLDEIRTPADRTNAFFIRTVNRLKSMRTLSDVRFAYIMRRTDDPLMLEFIADADSLSTPAELDLNGNNVVDPDEEASQPGDLYDIADIPALQGPAFEKPSSDQEVTYDQWGSLMSGYAPIRRADGSVAGILGIDIQADRYFMLSQSAFTPIALLFVILIAIVISGGIIMLWERRQISVLNKVNAERSGLLKLTFHQIGEPLTIMKWSLETLRDDTNSPELKKLVEDHVVCMDEGLGRLNSIIDTLQQAEKVDLNTMDYVPAPTSLRTLLDNAIGEWKSSADKRNQTIEVLMSHDITLPLDHTLIGLVLRQLLQNALEYSPDGSGITIRVTPSRKQVVISVEDHGCGIPKADMERMFEKYRRASNAPLHKPDGNGLGLYIARGIITRAGGKIWIESIEGSGTKVSFTLPL